MDSLVRPMPVVVMGPSTEHGGSLRGMTVDDAVGPLAQRRLDEAFGLAVGLRTIGSRELVFESQAPTGVGEAFRAEGRALAPRGRNTAVRYEVRSLAQERGSVGGEEAWALSA